MWLSSVPLYHMYTQTMIMSAANHTFSVSGGMATGEDHELNCCSTYQLHVRNVGSYIQLVGQDSAQHCTTQ